MENTFAYNLLKEHTTLISKVVELTGCNLYLELGIETGNNIKEVSKYCKRCIGVDVTTHNLSFRDFEFHQKTTDEFFKDFNETPDIIFIDADHHFEQVKKDFVNSLNCLSEHGIIFLHDTDPIDEGYLEQNKCGDSYQMNNWLKDNYSYLNFITLPISVSGLTIVNRDKDRRIFKFM